MVRFVVAHSSEASPLIDRFHLEPVAEGPFRVFRGDDDELGAIWLIVSGPGKAAAAAATSYLHLLAGGRMDRAWINAGVAGHCKASVGQGFVAHKVADAASGAAWYPQLVGESPRPTAPVLSLERVEEEYTLPWIYEMEAAGFVPTAGRFATAELVHCYKVISDTPDTLVSRRMPAAQVAGLVEDNLGGITELARGLAVLARELDVLAMEPPGFSEALERWPFPEADRPRLRRLLRRVTVLVPAVGPQALWEEIGAAGPASRPDDVLHGLEVRLAVVPVLLAEPADGAGS
ncbi:MAG TPA: hypothetical protein DD490_09475 [Acidobacteria bacterium]|nr:hypothetical protein [Acidobacteriota bacterium]